MTCFALYSAYSQARTTHAYEANAHTCMYTHTTCTHACAHMYADMYVGMYTHVHTLTQKILKQSLQALLKRKEGEESRFLGLVT